MLMSNLLRLPHDTGFFSQKLAACFFFRLQLGIAASWGFGHASRCFQLGEVLAREVGDGK